MWRGILLGWLVTALLAGCGDDEGDRPAASETETTETATLPPDEYSTLNSADDRVQERVTTFQDSLTSCVTSGEDAQIRSCFSRKYRPYGRSLTQVLEAINVAQDAAEGDCRDLLEEAEDSTRELQRSSDTLRTAFTDARYDDVDVDAFGTGFNGYRDDMDEALKGCA